MFLKVLSVGGLQTNCYVVGCREERIAVVIDPGADGERILQQVLSSGFTLRYILLTHGHGDHIGGIKVLKQATNVPVLIHTADVPMLTDAAANLSLFIGKGFTIGTPDQELHHGDVIRVGKLSFEVRHTPGHTPGSVCYLNNGTLFSGDTLFAGSVGRTDFPGGSHQNLLLSIRNQLLSLPDETMVYPGHGPATTIEEEREHNPFF